ncbi:hypothetical protein H0H87_009572 [Tephrocybe sp. NHM501043]|nr:hypothetical protein H0H87_009572 [Tephrocybe sp. NHM501043]
MTECNPTYSQIQLPLELINDIIVELSGDWRSLEACSLTAHVLREPSQKALFKILTIDLDPTNIAVNNRLNDVMASNKLLGTYVKTLRLKIRSTYNTTGALKRLPFLRSLSIDGSDGRFDTPLNRHQITIWPRISYELQLDLLDLVRPPMLEELTFTSFSDFPLGVLKNCPHLKNLHYIGCMPPPQPEDDDITEPHCYTWGYLETLTAPAVATQLVMDSFNNSSSFLALSRLRRYNSLIYSGNRDIVTVQGVFDLAAPSLEIISITALLDDIPGLHLDLRKLTNLRVVRIKTARPVSVAIRFAVTMLETIPEQNRIESVEFTITGNGALEEESEDEKCWNAMDNKLAQVKLLRRVSVMMIHSIADYQNQSKIRRWLTKLDSQGIIDFQFIRIVRQ